MSNLIVCVFCINSITSKMYVHEKIHFTHVLKRILKYAKHENFPQRCRLLYIDIMNTLLFFCMYMCLPDFDLGRVFNY